MLRIHVFSSFRVSYEQATSSFQSMTSSLGSSFESMTASLDSMATSKLQVAKTQFNSFTSKVGQAIATPVITSTRQITVTQSSIPTTVNMWYAPSWNTNWQIPPNTVVIVNGKSLNTPSNITLSGISSNPNGNGASSLDWSGLSLIFWLFL